MKTIEMIKNLAQRNSVVASSDVLAVFAELEAKDKRIGELEVIATEYAGKFQKAQDANKHLIIMSNDDKKRIAELEGVCSDASQVFKEIGNELGCNPDNESIMMAIDDLKATQITGTLAMIIKRAEEMERILEGVTPEMIAGGWTAKGISDYAKSLEAKLATPVRLPDVRQSSSGDRYQWSDGAHNYRLDVISMLLGAGFTVAVEGDE
ncbi:hypothetical protein [Serratia marcescens]|uniref:hypothetical protein n=1 Tax=Serratia marcescens TaxID=615 RepID=UPI003FA76B44